MFIFNALFALWDSAAKSKPSLLCLEWKRQICQTEEYHYPLCLPIHSIWPQKVATLAKMLHYQHREPTLREICTNKTK